MNKDAHLSFYTIAGWIVIAGIFVLGWILQQHSLFSYDVSWLMHATRRFIHGGNYYKNFVEPNPPLILYLYSLPVFIAQSLHISFITAARLFTLLIALVSLFITHYLASKMIQNKKHLFLLTVAIAMIFVLLPAFEFGQREHLTLMMIVPYLFLEATQLHHIKHSSRVMICIGILAGIGFTMKPYFVVVPFLVECFLCAKQKNIFYSLRLENFIMMSVIVLYICSIMIITPQYIHTILPLALHFYSLAYQTSLTDLFLQPSILFTSGSIIFYITMRSMITDKSFTDILLVGIIGFLIVYFIEGGIWYYHSLPAFGLASILMTFCFLNLSKQFTLLLLMLVFLLPASISYKMYQKGITFKNQKIFQQMITLINQRAAHHSVEVLSDCITGIYPWIDYTHSYSASRYGSLWILPGILKAQNNRYNRSAKKFLLQSVAQDIANHHPRLLFVDVAKTKAHIQQSNFDYIQYFSENPLFKKEFKHYRFLKKIGSYNVYTYLLTKK